MKHPLFTIPALILLAAASTRALDAAPPAEEEDKKERVQYQLVLPEEKSPETVKPEEHNPFESEAEASSRNSPGDTEENRVRDILMKLPVSGMSRKPDGRLRVMLGDIDLTVGEYVPQVLPDQLVELKVKSITSEYIELAWQEKQMIGLPPKLMVIPIDMEPSVTYRMKGAVSGSEAHMTRIRRGGGITRNGVPVTSGQQVLPAAPVQATAPPAIPAGTTRPSYGIQPGTDSRPPATPQTPPSSSPPPASSPPPTPAPAGGSAIESMTRMLFGNPPPPSP
ncbi:MAG: hypothetical protein JNG86_21740 [Verrucomicrobiaceae bacterium]|nr:hypothetical protein [Verrucomicrobiaceae bacterium]